MKRFVIYLLGLLILLSSCQKTVDYNIGDGMVKPVVYAFLADDKAMVRLFWSSSYVSDNDEPEINDASITLYEVESSLGVFSLVSDGVYELTGICPKANTEYSITIDVPGYDSTIVTKTTMPSKVPAILSVTRDSIYIDYADTVYYNDNLTLVFDDPGGVSNYYSYKVDKVMYLDGEEYCEKEEIMESVDWIGNSYPLMFTVFERANTGGYCSIMFHDKYIDGTRYEYEVDGLDYDIENPDYVPPDYSGFFEPGDNPMFIEVDSAYIVPHFRAINYDYYKFYCDALGQPAIGLSASEANYVYSNVENGYGIFGAYCEVSDTICVHRNLIRNKYIHTISETAQ